MGKSRQASRIKTPVIQAVRRWLNKAYFSEKARFWSMAVKPAAVFSRTVARTRTAPFSPGDKVSTWLPKPSTGESATARLALVTNFPLASKFSAPSASTMTRPAPACFITAWRRLTARSVSWMSQSLPRPITGSAAASGFSRTMSGAPTRLLIWRRIKLIASPEEEDADDMRGKRGDQREGGGNMDEQPHFQQAAQADMAARLCQGGALFFEQAQDLVQGRGLRAVRHLAARRRQHRQGVTRGAIAVAVGQALPDSAADAGMLHGPAHQRRLVLVQRAGHVQQAPVQR